jgi:divalent metal cation (Fe/Co/Zn/Cd) transporter
VFKVVDETEGVYNPHHVRIRQINNTYLIAMDIEVDADMKVKDAHEIAHEVDKNVRKKLGNVYDILIHVEPKGTDDRDECFGVSSKDLK